MAVDVDQPAVLQQIRHPLPLLRKKPAVLLVAAPVLQVDRLVRDVDVPAQHEFTFGAQGVEVGSKPSRNRYLASWRSGPDEPLGK